MANPWEVDFYDRYLSKKRFERLHPGVADQLEWYQRTAVQPKKVWMPILADADGWYQSDTTFFPPVRGEQVRTKFGQLHKKQLQPILMAIEMTSRKIYAWPMRHTTAAEVRRVWGGENGLPADCVHMAFDPGVEFKGDVEPWLEERDIEYYRMPTKDLSSKGLIERANKTLKTILIRYVNTVGPDWVSALPSILEVINDRVNRTTGYAPNAVTPEIAQIIRARQHAKAGEYLALLHSFAPGDRVRVLLPRGIFHKIGAVWSKTIHTVEGIDGYRVSVDGYRWPVPPRNLQKVGKVIEHDVKPSKPEKERKVNQKVISELRNLDAAIKLDKEAQVHKPGPRLLRSKVPKGKATRSGVYSK
jgi:hypothetical protein